METPQLKETLKPRKSDSNPRATNFHFCLIFTCPNLKFSLYLHPSEFSAPAPCLSEPQHAEQRSYESGSSDSKPTWTGSTIQPESLALKDRQVLGLTAGIQNPS